MSLRLEQKAKELENRARSQGHRASSVAHGDASLSGHARASLQEVRVQENLGVLLVGGLAKTPRRPRPLVFKRFLSSSEVVKLTRRVGSTVLSTGRTWTGPAGGLWVECGTQQTYYKQLYIVYVTYILT